MAITKTGSACPNNVLEGTDQCPVHHGGELARARQAALGRRSAEKRAEKTAALRDVQGERLALETEEDIQNLIERAAALTLSGAGPKGIGADVSRLVQSARLLQDVRALKAENVELRKLLKIKRTAIKVDTAEGEEE